MVRHIIATLPLLSLAMANASAPDAQPRDGFFMASDSAKIH
jgi:hypothetical protein